MDPWTDLVGAPVDKDLPSTKETNPGRDPLNRPAAGIGIRTSSQDQQTGAQGHQDMHAHATELGLIEVLRAVVANG